jgi:hypothetical protein
MVEGVGDWVVWACLCMLPSQRGEREERLTFSKSLPNERESMPLPLAESGAPGSVGT